MGKGLPDVDGAWYRGALHQGRGDHLHAFEIFAMNVRSETRSKYLKVQTELKRNLDGLMMISYLSGDIFVSNHKILATKLYTRLTIAGMTIYSIIPGNSINKTELLDLPSIANLIRMFIETSHRYFYLADEMISDEEMSFRQTLYYYHLNTEKLKIYKASGAKFNIRSDFEQKLQNTKNEIINTAQYGELSKHMAYKVRNGLTDMHITDEEIAKKIDLASSEYAGVYRLLSAHVHGAPFATVSQYDIRGRGFENDDELTYLNLLLPIITLYTAKLVLTQAGMLKLEQRCTQELEVARATLSRT